MPDSTLAPTEDGEFIVLTIPFERAALLTELFSHMMCMGFRADTPEEDEYLESVTSDLEQLVESLQTRRCIPQGRTRLRILTH